jgi:hypothetical protein
LAKSAVTSEGRRLNQDFMSVVNMTSELSNLITRHATARAAQTKSLLTSLASLLGVFSIFAGPSFAFAVAGMVSSTIEFAFTIVDYFNNPAWSNEINKQDRLNKLTAKTGNKAEDATRSQIAKLLSAGNEGDAAVAQAELRRLNKLKEQLAKIHESGGNSNVRGALGKASRTPGGLGSEAVSAENSLIEGLTNITTNNFASKQQFESSKQGKALGLINASIGILQSGLSLSQQLQQPGGVKFRSFKEIAQDVKNNSGKGDFFGMLKGVAKGVFNLGQSAEDRRNNSAAAALANEPTSSAQASTTTSSAPAASSAPANAGAAAVESSNLGSTGLARTLVGALGPVGMQILISTIRLVAGQLSAGDLMNSDNFNESTTGETDSNGQFVVEGKNSDGSDKIKGRHGVSTIGGDTNKEASYRGQAKGREAILQAEVNLKEKKKSDFFAVDIKTAEATISNGENAEGREVSKTTLEILGGGKGKEKEGRARLEQIVGKDGLGTDDKTGQLKITKKFDTLYNPEQLFRGLSVGLSAVKNILDVLTSTIEKDKLKKGLEERKKTIERIIAAMLSGGVPQHQVLEVLASLMGQQKQAEDQYAQAANAAFGSIRQNFEVGAIDRGYHVDANGKITLSVGAGMSGGLLAAAFEGENFLQSKLGSSNGYDKATKAKFERLTFDDQKARETLGILPQAEIDKISDPKTKEKMQKVRTALDDYRNGTKTEDDFRKTAKEYIKDVGYLIIGIDKANFSKNEADVSKDQGNKVAQVSNIQAATAEKMRINRGYIKFGN